MGKAPARIPGGFILLARKTLENPVLANGPPLYSKLWDWMIMQANWQNREKLKRGQFVTTIRDMQDAMSWKVGYRTKYPTRDEIRSAYEAFAKTTMITTTKTTRGMIITVLNYSLYQDPKNYEAHSEPHNEAPTNPTVTPQDTEEGEERKKEPIEGSGKKPPDPRVSKLCKFWDEQYQKHYGRKYTFSGGKEPRIFKDLLRSWEPRALCERIKLFFTTDDEWITGAGHTLTTFVATINKPLTASPSARPPERDEHALKVEQWKEEKEAEGKLSPAELEALIGFKPDFGNRGGEAA